MAGPTFPTWFPRVHDASARRKTRIVSAETQTSTCHSYASFGSTGTSFVPAHVGAYGYLHSRSSRHDEHRTILAIATALESAPPSQSADSERSPSWHNSPPPRRRRARGSPDRSTLPDDCWPFSTHSARLTVH